MKPLLLLFLLITVNAYAQEKMHWPQQKKAAIVLTYDDGLLSQLNVAVPQLKTAHFPATFFLTGDVNKLTTPQWRALSKQGFELGNHTLFHPCAGVDDNPVTSNHYNPYGIIREIEVMNHLLNAIDGKNNRTYAYPCAETTVGDGKDYVDTLRKYALVKYARVGGDASDGVITDFKHLDPLRIPSFGVEDGTDAEKLIAFVKNVEQKGGMGIIMLHGIGGDYITVSASAHQELLNYLSKSRKTIWITTFQQAMDFVMESGKPNVKLPQGRASIPRAETK
ncbi:polysaccharide deacetylase family protein [Mucilaginibacter aquaedulcis]|uniref:polysaccharide deacetylase family protein n=1 Tax=Mucilaginibacter aquaedulcis TaxID=1187081 RepID=UPI0025B2BEC6|nr:polysaccharide deacetylase family protein [Mucilaginibacter aquaedulcis]MDN3547461.1 polysaccharide deacetylase family protein [Mucilaginibacter aquaedulcis]